MVLPEQRFWEVDLLRGCAIVLMIIYHTFYDLDLLGNFSFAVNQGELWIIGRSSAVLFIYTAGIALSLSYSRYRLKHPENRNPWQKYVKRGIRLFLWGGLITAVSWFAFPSMSIIFGILHFLGISIIFAYPLIEKKHANLIIAGVVIAIGFYLKTIRVPNDWFLWLGLHSTSFQTLDYFPLLPWFGLVLIGIATSNHLYPGYERRFSIPDMTELAPVRLLTAMGKRSLAMYLLHQPAIILILYLLGLIRFPFSF
ncbi:heparan-alpha-glucosaminide N-acetyltransferase [Methanohalophilus halophilus]|nr:heparan-alpha-glucosaminide N-acetyltransferase [Methanohalophilus halophilus]SDW34918.1 Uncharacterized membrane protein [Methanohalophilus halophilus]